MSCRVRTVPHKRKVFPLRHILNACALSHGLENDASAYLGCSSFASNIVLSVAQAKAIETTTGTTWITDYWQFTPSSERSRLDQIPGMGRAVRITCLSGL